MFEDDDHSKVNPEHVEKLEVILGYLDEARTPEDMNFDGFDLHRLKGKRRGVWAVKVSGGWRVTFRFDGNDVTDVDYENYH